MKLPAQPNGRLYVVIGVFLLSVSRKLPVSINGRVSQGYGGRHQLVK